MALWSPRDRPFLACSSVLTRQYIAARVILLSKIHRSFGKGKPSPKLFLSFLSGFTGSNAELLVTADEAFLWTDSRYWEQAERQLLNSGIALMRDGEKDVPSVAEWLSEVNAKKSTVLALPLETLPLGRCKKIQESVTKVIDFPDKAITKQWPDRPKRDVFPLYIHHASSVSAADKRKRLQEYIESVDIQGSPSALLLTKLDDIAWLTNLRGSDIAFNVSEMPILITSLFRHLSK